MTRYIQRLILLFSLLFSAGMVTAQAPDTARPELVLQIGHVNTVTTLAWSPDGKTVASGSKDQSVKLWDSQSGALLFSLTTHSGAILAVAFSSDSRTVYTASEDGSVRAWNVSSGALVGNVRGPGEHLTAAAISGAGTQVLVAGVTADQPITLWHDDPLLSADGQIISALKGHPKTVHALAFSADGKLLASGSDDGTVKYWDTTDGSLQRTVRGHAMTINSVAFSADSAYLADASDDGITQVWNLDTGKDQHELEMNRPGDGIAAVAWSPDGGIL